jgi:KUP system potassium uptake protein
LPLALDACNTYGLRFQPLETSYFLSRATVVATPGEGMALWREKLFGTMLRNVGDVANYLKLPANQVIELGARIEI